MRLFAKKVTHQELYFTLDQLEKVLSTYREAIVQLEARVASLEATKNKEKLN